MQPLMILLGVPSSGHPPPSRGKTIIKSFLQYGHNRGTNTRQNLNPLGMDQGRGPVLTSPEGVV